MTLSDSVVQLRQKVIFVQWAGSASSSTSRISVFEKLYITDLEVQSIYRRLNNVKEEEKCYFIW